MGSYTVNKDIVVTDETKQNPTLIYGVTKVFGELLGLYYHRKFGIDFRGIRLPQLIGPNVKTSDSASITHGSSKRRSRANRSPSGRLKICASPPLHEGTG